MWNSIHYKADAEGRPNGQETRAAVQDLIESGFSKERSLGLTKINASVAIEAHSTSPSEISTTSSEGDVDEWEDVEPDEEVIVFKSLIDEKPFKSLAQMCKYDRSQWNFDLIATRHRLDLDFLESIQLVNYVRSKSRENPLQAPNIVSKAEFVGEKYLQPVLEDDAVLFSLDDLDGDATEGRQDPTENATTNGDTLPPDMSSYVARIAVLERALERSKEAFLIERSSGEAMQTHKPRDRKHRDEHDRFYFNSYSGRDIHEEMLKDSARTEAYRDFIYDNKHLFDGKIVLDVGCGTGILSLMCAKAGAKHVYAVDNSDIIDKAREIAYVNGMQDNLTCLRGMIEEIHLPVDKVDIIVSEWMGYALLYEAMLDSVLFARDKWLHSDGLMIPSEISLHMALLADPELIVDKSDFWSDVYGFDMRVMRKGVFEGAMIEIALPSVIPSNLSSPEGCSEILHLDLHRAAVSDLTFSKAFRLQLSRGIDALDGFVVWFDAIFGRSGRSDNIVRLSTGPLAKRTHWQQVKLIVDRHDRAAARLPVGTIVNGSIEYSRLSNEHRNLEITVKWNAEEANDSGTQHWRIDY